MSDEEENIRDRFRQVAIDLFRSKGFDRTTAAEIARGAGVTERTFFRYYPDKRDVLFEGEALVRTLLVAAVTSAPNGMSALDTVRKAIDVLTPVLEAFRPFAKFRNDLIRSTPSLQEREGARAAALAKTLARSLERRGFEPSVAGMAAIAGLTALTLAASRWFDAADAPLSRFVGDAFGDLRTVLTAIE